MLTSQLSYYIWLNLDFTQRWISWLSKTVSVSNYLSLHLFYIMLEQLLVWFTFGLLVQH